MDRDELPERLKYRKGEALGHLTRLESRPIGLTKLSLPVL